MSDTLIIIIQVDYNTEQKQLESHKLCDKLKAMSTSQIDEVYDSGLILRKDQHSSIDTNCLPCIGVNGIDIFKIAFINFSFISTLDVCREVKDVPTQIIES